MALSKAISFNPNMEFGVGVDDLTGETRGIIFDYDSIKYTSGLSSVGQTGYFFMKIVEDAETLFQSMNVSAEAGGRYGLFSADAKFDFMNTSKFNSQSTFLIARVQINNRQKQFFKANIKPEVIELLKNGEETLFRERYGDFYVQGITDGGEFNAIVEIKCFSKEDERKIASELQATYGTPIAGAELDVKVKSEELKSVKHKEITISCFQVGGKGPGITFETTIEGLIEKAKNFAIALGEQNSVPHIAHLKSYKTLELPKVNYVAIRAKEDALNDCARKRLRYLTLLNDIDFYDNNATIFELPVIPDERLADWKLKLTHLINELTRHAVRVVEDYSFSEFFLEQINNEPVIIGEMVLPKRIVMLENNKIIVLDYKTMDLDKAVLELSGKKLKIEYRSSVDPAATRNIVYDQFPTAGTEVSPGQSVTLFYTKPKPPKDQLISEADLVFAKTQLGASGFFRKG